ncbi:hypothetical protein ABTE85_20225, partial [Acinetobacter baumannii]
LFFRVGKGRVMRRKGKRKLDFYAILYFIYTDGTTKNGNISKKAIKMAYSAVADFVYSAFKILSVSH